jgi:hypothetical protein
VRVVVGAEGADHLFLQVVIGFPFLVSGKQQPVEAAVTDSLN